MANNNDNKYNFESAVLLVWFCAFHWYLFFPLICNCSSFFRENVAKWAEIGDVYFDAF